MVVVVAIAIVEDAATVVVNKAVVDEQAVEHAS